MLLDNNTIPTLNTDSKNDHDNDFIFDHKPSTTNATTTYIIGNEIDYTFPSSSSSPSGKSQSNISNINLKNELINAETNNDNYDNKNNNNIDNNCSNYNNNIEEDIKKETQISNNEEKNPHSTSTYLSSSYIPNKLNFYEGLTEFIPWVGFDDNSDNEDDDDDKDSKDMKDEIGGSGAGGGGQKKKRKRTKQKPINPDAGLIATATEENLSRLGIDPNSNEGGLFQMIY